MSRTRRLPQAPEVPSRGGKGARVYPSISRESFPHVGLQTALVGLDPSARPPPRPYIAGLTHPNEHLKITGHAFSQKITLRWSALTTADAVIPMSARLTIAANMVETSKLRLAD